MAGENVSESVVRKVFASTIDYVVHLDRDDVNRLGPEDTLRRQVMEIIAVAPSMSDDFTTEPIFVRDGLGEPLRWTGARPPKAGLIDRALPEWMSVAGILEGRQSALDAPAPSPQAVRPGHEMRVV
jgi:hypothetical protein